MSYNYIDVINKNMSEKNPKVYKNLKKRLSTRDIAILDLLSRGNTILFISNTPSRTKLFNTFAYFEMEYLVCDFEEDILDESFLEYIIEDFDMSKDYQFDELLQKKRDIEFKVSILSKPYSNLGLLPHILKEKREYHLNKLNNEELIFTIKDINKYDLTSIESIIKNFRCIIENYSDVFSLNEKIHQDFLKSEDFKNLILISNSFKKNLNEFISLNNNLNKLLGLKKFNNFNNLDLLGNMHVFSENCVYVVESDRYGLNEILKIYINKPSIDLSSFSLVNKYALENQDLLESIENNIKYSELIDNNIRIDDKKQTNLILLNDKINILVNISKYLKKQLNEISKFYEKFPFFELDQNSFNAGNDFGELLDSFDAFCKDLNNLIKYDEFLEYSYTNEDEKFFIDLVLSEKLGKNNVCDAFLFNIYNHIFNNFLNEFAFIDESRLKIEDYSEELNSLKDKLGDSGEDQQFINLIKYYSATLNNDELIIKQRNDLNQKIINSDYESIPDVLMEFKELVLANRRIFLISEESLPKLSEINYTQDFDYIVKGDEIITNKG